MTEQNETLSPDAKRRLAWFMHCKKSGNVRLTCRKFAISPSTFYHWKKKYIPSNPRSLEDTASRRPKTIKKTKWNYLTILLIERFLEQKPYSKNKEIQFFLAKQNVQLSASTISRIMKLVRRKKYDLS